MKVEVQEPDVPWTDEPPCDGRCDGRLEVDPHCSRHGDPGRDYWNLRRMRAELIDPQVLTVARRVKEEFDRRAVAVAESYQEWWYTQKLSDAIRRDDCKRKLLEFADVGLLAEAILRIAEQAE